jgi:protein-S-isoprenylcysteine O-methyltransferase Ste14
MPKLFQAPEDDKHNARRTPRRTAGRSSRPEREEPSLGPLIAVAVIVMLLVLFLMYRAAARGEPPEPVRFPALHEFPSRPDPAAI